MKIYRLNLSSQQQKKYSIWNARNNQRKALDVFSGIVLGIVADGSINSQEATFLIDWVKSNKEEIPNKLTKKLLPILNNFKNSCSLEGEELDPFLDLILGYAGLVSTKEDTSLSKETSPSDLKMGKPADWYFDTSISSIDFENNIEFALSGNFLTGEKSEIKESILKKGALVAPKQPRAVTNFLIIGEKGSDQWSSSNLGNSIKKALSMQENGSSIKILKESTLMKFLNS